MIETVTIDADHRYWKGDERVPGYSEICASMQIGKEDCQDCADHKRHMHDGSFWTEDGRNQGVALHYWLQFLAKGLVSSIEPEPEIAGRVEGIKKFIRETRFAYAGGETIQYEPLLRFACTPDIWGVVSNTKWVIDMKRGAEMKSHALQTAAQKIALAANGFTAIKRGALYLMDGDYRLMEHKDRRDESCWRTIVQAYNAKKLYI